MKEKRPVGRPTKYKPEYCEQLVEHMSKGFSYTTFGAVIDVSLECLYEWERVHPEFSEAKKRAFQKCQLHWETEGKKGMWNTSGEGQHENLNTTFWIYNMKCRFPKDFRDIQEHQFTTKEVDKLDRKQLIEETKRTLEFLEAEYLEDSKDAQGKLPAAKE